MIGIDSDYGRDKIVTSICGTVMLDICRNSSATNTTTTLSRECSWLVDLLDSHPEVTCFSEVFVHDHYGSLPHGGRQDVDSWDSYSTLRLPGLGRRQRLRLYFEYLDQQIYSARDGVSTIGFKLMYSHATRGFGIPAYLKLANVSIIHLVRENHLDVLISEETVRAI